MPAFLLHFSLQSVAFLPCLLFCLLAIALRGQGKAVELGRVLPGEALAKSRRHVEAVPAVFHSKAVRHRHHSPLYVPCGVFS